MATLYRCRNPSDWLCRCGTVARRLRRRGIDVDEVRVPYPKGERYEVEELTGQRRVPVLVNGEEVIHESHRILEYLDWLEERAEAERAAVTTALDGARRKRSATAQEAA